MSNPYVTYADSHRAHPIQRHPEGYHSEILDRGQKILDAAIQRYRRVYFVRMDLHFPDNQPYPATNDYIRLFMEEFRVDRMNAGHDLLYIWVWEQDTSVNHHYHCCFLFDGNRTQNIYGHVDAARRIWGRRVGVPPEQSPVWDCTRDCHGIPQVNGIRIDANDPTSGTQYAQAYHWMSYLAKVITKTNVPDGQRKMGSSTLPSTR